MSFFRPGTRLTIILVIIILSLCALLTWLLRDAGLLPRVFAHGVYYSLWTTVILLLIAAWGRLPRDFPMNVLQGDWKPMARRIAIPAGLGLLGAVLVFTAITPAYRILADEANLLSASLSLHGDRSLYNLLETDFIYGRLHPVHYAVAHRPGFFAFLTSLLHALLGYSPAHPFVVNFLVCWALLGGIAGLALHRGDFRFAFAAAILTAAHPLFALTSTSAGFDLLNAMMISLVYVILYRFARNPEPGNLDLLLPAWLLAAQCRYESAVLIIPVLLVMGLHWKKVLEWGPRPIPLLCIPLALPILWQKMISTHVANPGDSDAVAFAFANIPANIQNALEFFLDPFARGFPVLEVMTLAGFAGAILLVLKLKGDASPEGASMRRALLLVLLGHVLISLVQFAYYFGDIRRPWVMRLGIIHLPFLALTAAYAMRRLDIAAVRRLPAARPALYAFLFMLLAVGLSRANDNKIANSLTGYREYRDNMRFLKKYPRSGTLIISERSVLYAARKRASRNIDSIKKKLIALHNQMAGRYYQDVLLIQTCEYKTGKPLPAHSFGGKLKLRKLHEYSMTDKQYIRISKVEAVDLAKVLPPGSLKPAPGVKSAPPR